MKQKKHPQYFSTEPNSVLKNEAPRGRVCDNSVVALNLVATNQSVEHIFKNQTLDINKKKLQDIPEASL